MTSFFKTIALALLVLAASFAGSLALYSAAAFTLPTLTPPQGNIALPINASPNSQTKLGPVGATAFYDTDNPSYFFNPSATSILGGPLCLGTGQGTNAGATCGTGSQQLNQLKNVAAPTDPQDAATKAYVNSVKNSICPYSNCFAFPTITFPGPHATKCITYNWTGWTYNTSCNVTGYIRDVDGSDPGQFCIEKGFTGLADAGPGSTSYKTWPGTPDYNPSCSAYFSGGEWYYACWGPYPAPAITAWVICGR